MLLRLLSGLTDGRAEAEAVAVVRQGLLEWLSAQIDNVDEAAPDSIAPLQTIRGLARSIAEELRSEAPTRWPLTLDNFPEAFEPLTILCGDRRESPPRSVADLFTFSMSITDLRFLHEIPFSRHTKIYSDKSLVAMSHEELKKLYGQSHLLIIGSAATNIGGRMINRWSIFRFALDTVLNTFHERLVRMTQLQDDDVFRAFLQILGLPFVDEREGRSGASLSRHELRDLSRATRELLGRHRRTDLPDRFRSAGLLDPLAPEIMNLPTRSNNDFALVSMAVHPFTDDNEYTCIVAAGRRSRGTAHAVRALAEDRFTERPLGGIFRLELPDGRARRSWLFEEGERHFETKPYEIATLRAAFNDALGGNITSEYPLLASFAQDELQACLALIQRVAHSAP